MSTFKFFRKSDTVWYFLLFALLLLTLYIQYLSKYGYIPLTGIYVPDGYSYELRALENRELEEFSAFSYNLFNQFIYNSFLGAFGFFLFNSSLLFLSVWLCRPVFASISENSINYARFAIVFNPYLLIGAIGPNKESILLFINLLFWYLCFSGYRDHESRSNNQGNLVAKIIDPVAVFTLASVPLFIRPIVSIILYISLIYKIVGFKKTRLVATWLLVCYFLSVSIPVINEIYAQQVDQGLSSFSGSTVYDAAETLSRYSLDPIMQYPAFIAKTILLFFGFVIRPFSFSALLDVGYTFLALAYFPINLSLILTFLKNTKRNYDNLSRPDNDNTMNTFLFFTLLSMFIVIVSPGFTFRYFIPVTPFSFGLFIFQNSSTRKILVTISVLIGVLVIVGNLIFYQKSYYQDVSLPVFMDWL
ncbi:hypothetical protein [Cylindrospermopsis sp. CR12]|uniref:hypothetical protein n=1 Tax=Cylindrospermopsis sp. CR12 TaxID=1747196 RepID=UPI00070B8451|nr:hypothetical protein [Cylindrospermopsis sp. CR12]KRH96854.1 hypothetical protein ASL19_15900 [Cylindrospermopsis sp. CR12]